MPDEVARPLRPIFGAFPVTALAVGASAAHAAIGGSGRDWTPPPHAVGWLGRAAEPLVAAIAWASVWRFPLLPILIVGSLVLGAIFRRVPLLRRVRVPLVVAAIGYGILNIPLGPWLSGALLYHAGRSGAATITGTFATSTQYNDHDVIGYDVLIRTAEGPVVKTSFEDDDFNVYPSGNATRYPDVEDRFTVRYLPHFPSRFVIVADDASPWLRGLRCTDLQARAAQTERDRAFATDDPGFARAAAAAKAASVAAGC